jgi:uncharacterized protein (DUF2141 family)
MMRWFAAAIAVSLTFVSVSRPWADESASIRVKMKGFRSEAGKAAVSLFASPDGFPNDSSKASNRVIKDIHNGVADVVFNNVSPGRYAIAVLHDENNNQKMDTNFIGMPKEGYGVSNNVRRKMGPPRFEDAAFEVKGKTTIDIEIGY